MSPLPIPLVWTCAGAAITGFLHVPVADARQGMVLVAGGTQTRVGAHRMLVHLASRLAAGGIAVLRFDVRGRGDSSGNYPGFDALDQDIAAAIAALKQAQPQLASIAALGHCDGAAAIAFAAARQLDADQLILLNPWARTAETQASIARSAVTKNLTDSNRWKKLLRGEVNISKSLAAVISRFTRSAKVDIPATGLLAQWRQAWPALRQPMLVVTGEQDASGQEFLALLPALGAHPALHQMVIPGGDHSFSSRQQTDQLYQSIYQWLQTVTRR